MGGESADGPVATASVIDPRTRIATPLPALQVARTGHTAILLADGTVLVTGGRGPGGEVLVAAEVFDPRSNTFAPIAVEGARPRTDHTATILTDGRVLVAGGSGPDGALGDGEIWDVAQARVNRAVGTMTRARFSHEAELMADGRVRIGRGVGADGVPLTEAELFDPQTGLFAPTPPEEEDRSLPRLVASLPQSGALDVPLDARIALRFSHPLQADSVNVASIVMTGPDGPVDVTLVATEQGRLVFVSPRLTLGPNTQYLITVDGAVDRRGVVVPSTSVALTTRDAEKPAGIPDQEAWAPDGVSWRSRRADSSWQSLKPLQAPPGVTALAGQVLRLDGRPLANVTLTMEGRTARTDGTGRFLLLLEGITTGEHTFAIDARTASRPGRTYGFYEVRWKIQAGRTTVLPFTIWSPLIDTAHQVTIPVPTTRETVITTPTMPGLELHLPAGTTILDEDRKAVRTISLTPIPLDRTPFPLPADATFTMFFTIQPGGAYVYTNGPSKGAWLVYPKRTDHPVGAKLPFLNYDPDDKGWFVYGLGTVTATQVVPDPKTRIYAFTGASFNSGPQPGPAAGPGREGDPVDPSSGAFIMEKTDLYLPDVMPLALTRTYNSLDNTPANSRPFGIGMTHAYSLYQWSVATPFTEGELILPDAERVHFTRISDPNGTWDTTVMEAQVTPNAFYKARLRFDGNAWEYTLKDGTVYILGHSAQLQRIRDRYGNETRLTWSDNNIFGAGVGNLMRITSPNGRWIAFTYDTNLPVNRITDATDNIGRTVHYTYDANGHLSTVTDPEGHVTTYTWDANHRMTSIKDGRNIVYLTNHYDANGRVDKQTLADPMASYTYAYTTDGGGNITRAEVTNPRGYTKQVNYNATHYLTSQVEALGQAEERLTTITRLPGSNLVSAVVDALVVDGSLRKTEYTYDDFGHVQSVKRLANTSNPVITSFTYEPTFFQLATVTDPLLHTWAIQYDAQGKMLGTIDPLSHQTTTVMNTQGQVTSVTDALQHSWQFGYVGGDLLSVTNPLGATTTRFVDGGGRVLMVTDPLGRVTRTTFDKLSNVSQVTDALGGQTVLQRDPNGRVLSLSDALTHATTYTYDDSDRAVTRTDPLQRTARYGYDRNDNVIQHIDRAGQVTDYQYDPLDRLTQVTYADGSTTQYFYDAGDRLWKVIDSIGGTIMREYDGLDRLTNETTPEGSVSYTYYGDGRRQTMTVLGQPQVTYTYDDAHRLESITQDTATVSMTYDNTDWRSTLTLPNGIVTNYGYDDANQITSLTYTSGQTTLGTLTYSYDPAGRRTSVGGTWAATGLPQPVLSATYDAANQIATWAGREFDHDANGNLVSDRLTSYSWNAGNRLAGLNGGTSAGFAYDGLGRRRSKTVGGTTTNLLYDGVNLVQELSGSTPTGNRQTGLAIDQTFTRIEASATSTFLVDGLGSTLKLADASGTVQTHYTYEPFGPTNASGVNNANTSQFTGREKDGTGLYYYRARYYDPEVGRFLSEDPLSPAQRTLDELNSYAYVSNNPTNFTDPEGYAKVKNNSGTPFPYKPEQEDYQPPKMCMPEETCDVDGIYSPPGSGKQCVVKIPDFCRATVDKTGKVSVRCLIKPPAGLGPGDLAGKDFQNWPDPYTGRQWPYNRWDAKRGCTCPSR